jgi:F-type H+-transporting ATPase subunit gamma
MAAQIRELRQRIRTVNSTKKITKAYELIATSRLAKAQARVAASRPYADEITNVLSALAEASANLDHPLLVERENPKRAAILVVTSDKGMCGGYNSNVL